ncbi:helix-turn-helix transcriptional regulator [Paenibacillus physcomitrellae]|uniref:HTH luxR-type domain-containing protein n=1 Tax=Paenibacillus physcomitrellae TaxID=1619311 RepID=A0ABQ1GET1_9BACL|nr:helix-turn-helix transcriptional regulator [Paenibacillus physcomitrellae]GGA42358.1 hypothetical protein GCM10010917_29550 [Paenibacillus physcomitrellae]
MEKLLINPHLEMLQELQDTYAAAAGASLYLTDRSGKLVIPASILHGFGGTIEVHNETLEDFFSSHIQKLSGLHLPALYDSWIPGIQMIIAPVRVHGVTLYYVWSGILIMEGMKERISLQELEENAGRAMAAFVAGLVKAAPETGSGEAERKRMKVGKLAEILAVIVEKDAVSTHLDDRFRRISQSLQAAVQQELLPSDKINWIMETSELGEIFGFALEEAPGEYAVRHAAGPASDSLIGLTFREGEGFLGQAVLNEGPSEWTNVQRDPRTDFFYNKGLKQMASLYCFPVRCHDRIAGLMFCIRTDSLGLSSNVLHFEKMFLSLMSAYAGAQLAYSQVDKQLARIKPLLDVGRFMVSIPDIKRLLFTLVDVSLNLAVYPEGALVVYRDERLNQFQTVARGLGSTTGIESCGREMMGRYFSELEQEPSADLSPVLRQRASGRASLELPVGYEDKIYAVLAVELRTERDAEDSREILYALSTMCSLVLRLLHERQNLSHMADQTAMLLFETIRMSHPEKYRTGKRIRSVVDQWGNWTGLKVEEQAVMSRTALLMEQDPDVLLSLAPFFRQEAEWLKEIHGLLGGEITGTGRSFSKAAQIITMAILYVRGDEHLMRIERLNGVDPANRSEFRHFIVSSQTGQSQFTVHSLHAESQSRTESAEAALDKAAVKASLSPREKEVLGLILKASSNKEIAAALFISEHTVKNHLTNIFQKMGVGDRAQAIAAVFNQS